LFFFHCHPQCNFTATENGVAIARGEIGIELFSDPAMEVQVLQGSLNPIAGWYSPGYNEIMECVTIRFYGLLAAEANILTHIIINKRI